MFLHVYRTNSTNFFNQFIDIKYFQSNPIFFYNTNSHHHPSFICIHINLHSYMQFVCIFNNYVFIIYYTSYTYHTYNKIVKIELLFIKKITDIDYIKNINLLQNHRNFETLYLPKCLHWISYITILLKNHKIFLNSNFKMPFCVVEVLWIYWHINWDSKSRI